MSETQTRKKYLITRIRYKDEKLIDLLINNKVYLNTEIFVEEKLQNTSSMAISLSGNPILLNEDAINSIYVQEIKN